VLIPVFLLVSQCWELLTKVTKERAYAASCSPGI